MSICPTMNKHINQSVWVTTQADEDGAADWFRVSSARDTRCTFGLSGAQQGVTGDNHVQDGFSEVGVEMSDGGWKHDDVLSERLIGIGQTPVHVTDTIVCLQSERQSQSESESEPDNIRSNSLTREL